MPASRLLLLAALVFDSAAALAMSTGSSGSLRFITNRLCPFAQRTWIALEESGLDYTLEEVPRSEVLLCTAASHARPRERKPPHHMVCADQSLPETVVVHQAQPERQDPGRRDGRRRGAHRVGAHLRRDRRVGGGGAIVGRRRRRRLASRGRDRRGRRVRALARACEQRARPDRQARRAGGRHVGPVRAGARTRATAARAAPSLSRAANHFAPAQPAGDPLGRIERPSTAPRVVVRAYRAMGDDGDVHSSGWGA